MTVKKLIDQVIEKGGDIAKPEKSDEKIVISLALPKFFLEQMDSFVSKRIGLSRTAWILEAIQEKMEK